MWIDVINSLQAPGLIHRIIIGRAGPPRLSSRTRLLRALARTMSSPHKARSALCARHTLEHINPSPSRTPDGRAKRTAARSARRPLC